MDLSRVKDTIYYLNKLKERFASDELNPKLKRLISIFKIKEKLKIFTEIVNVEYRLCKLEELEPNLNLVKQDLLALNHILEKIERELGIEESYLRKGDLNNLKRELESEKILLLKEIKKRNVSMLSRINIPNNKYTQEFYVKAKEQEELIEILLALIEEETEKVKNETN